MKVTLERSENRVVVALETEAEEACYVYDLLQSGRLQTDRPDTMPLPFRGHFLFKLPERGRPIEIQVGRLEPTATQKLAGDGALRLLVAVPAQAAELLPELEMALREVPPASEEEFKMDEAERMDEFARIRKMTFPQRVIYATRAGQTGRTALMQQPSSMLLLYLVKNPLITLPEVIAIAKMPSIDALVAEQIVKAVRTNPQWAMSEELKVSIALNVKTPGGTAISMLRHLNTKSLRRVAKAEVNSSLKNACIRILMERKD
jgi:hypothetical protein